MISHENGRLGEDIAAEFYEANGFKIISRNFRAGHDEIDIIAENKSSIVFSEVKTRTISPALQKYGSAKSAVNKEKQRHLLKAALHYLKINGNPEEKQPRMDVVEVYLTRDGKFSKLNYIRGAFGAGGGRR